MHPHWNIPPTYNTSKQSTWQIHTLAITQTWLITAIAHLQEEDNLLLSPFSFSISGEEHQTL
jgi:hypothetical protein